MAERLAFTLKPSRAVDFHPSRRASFDTAAAYLGGFGVRFGLVTGNHDLEGAEFRTDEENLAAWHQVPARLTFTQA